jgi:hypothetical protein
MEPCQFSLAIPDRRFAAIVATVLAHTVMIVVWLATRQTPLPDSVERHAVQWVQLPARGPGARAPDRSANDQPRVPVADGTGAPAPVPRHPRLEWTAPRPARIDEPDAATMSPSTASGLDAATPQRDDPAVSSRHILDQAKRAAGAIDRALRKENNAYIVAPPDSPQIRMRRKIEEAAALAPKHFWEAPKIEEVVNDSGDGTRRTRVTTGGRTYCITERSFATSIDMTEKHGKQMMTDCSRDNEKKVGDTQEWRTARD